MSNSYIFEDDAYSLQRSFCCQDQKMGRLREVKKTSPSNKTFPYPEETGKANYLSLGDMERRKVLTVRGSIYIDRRLYDFCPRLRFRKIFFRDSSVSSVFRCFLCFLCFLVKTMFFKETCFFFLKGLEKDTFQGQTVKWEQRNSSNQNYSLGVAY